MDMVAYQRYTGVLLIKEAHRVEFLPLPPLAEHPLHYPTANQILALCQRAFGSSVQVVSARELGGGTFNTTILITLATQQVIVRIAPPPTATVFWYEHALMRREQHMQPFFAALAPLMPRTLLADFTHQLIDRDYLIQTYLPGERWDAIAETFTPDEERRLWEQFGRITKTIHSTIGTSFGGPYPEPVFATWSETIVDRFESTLHAMVDAQLDLSDFRAVLAIVRGQTARLDAIAQPHLLHGDLWLYNLLVTRDGDGPAIRGVLDADQTWWGDPLADWTLFLLATAEAPETQPGHARFWQAYGDVAQTPETAFRQAVYEAMHIGTALVWAVHHDDDETLQRGRRDLAAAVTRLHPYAPG